jgi:hypothetical protein
MAAAGRLAETISMQIDCGAAGLLVGLVVGGALAVGRWRTRA